MRTSVVLLVAAVVTVFGACKTGNEAPNPDPATIGNELVDANSAGLSGIFLLGEDDYYTHSDKMDGAPAIVHVFSDWGGDWDAATPEGDKIDVDPIAPDAYEYFNNIFQPGTTLALTWSMPLPNYDVPGNVYNNIPNVQDILDGEYDDHIRDFAEAIDRLELPVMLTLFGEFDNNAFYSFGPDGRNSAFDDPDVPDDLDVPVADDLYGHYGDPDHPDGPERVRDAFIHVIEIFEEEGVTDPSWFMYASSGFMSTTPNPGEEQIVDATAPWNKPQWYYPGDQYIDWVGKSLHHDDLDGLKDKFERAYYAWGEVTHRPFFSPEYSLSMQQSSRADQIQQEFGSYLPSFARFKAFAITDQDPATGSDEFGLMTLGGVPEDDEDGFPFPGEIEAWKESVRDNPDWKTLPYDFLDD